MVQWGGFSAGSETEPGGEIAVTPEEQRRVRDFARWRRRFHDVPDARFEEIVQALRVPESINSIARGLIEAGYLAHLHPTTIRMHLTRFRDAMGWPRYQYFNQPDPEPEPPAKIDKLDETGEVIEAMPVMKQLDWLIRIQQARVRKTLQFEGQMAGMVLPMASAEIKLLSDLMDKEIEVALKTGDLKTVPQTVALDTSECPITDPAEAFRVVLAWKRLEALLASNVMTDEESDALTIDASPGAVGTRATSD